MTGMLGVVLVGFFTLSALFALAIGRWFRFMRDADERDEWQG
jgi:hypothetical protein